MPRTRSQLEQAAGKLIAAIQKEWHTEMGTPKASDSEDVMNLAHDLLKAAKSGSIVAVTGDASLAEFLGERWLHAHPQVFPFVRSLELLATSR